MCAFCDDQAAALRRMMNAVARHRWASHCRDCGYAQYGAGLL